MSAPETKLFSRLRKRWRKVCVALFVAVFMLMIASVTGLYLSLPLLTVEHVEAKADVIVVLGGEPTYRVRRAGELFEKGMAPRILVSGDGDAYLAKRSLVNQGVPASVIDVEPDSVNTRQNAQFSVKALKAAKAQRVILVTSWFHSRRVLACFRRSGPDMEFISLPTVEDRPKRHWPSQFERTYVLKEYMKLFAYWLRYGVWSFDYEKAA